MPMPTYQIFCQSKGCKNLAQYKVAARWSDGVVSELKTYGLCCEDCLKKWYARAQESHESCRLIPGETLEEPGIYHLERDHRDQVLRRAAELEQQFSNEP
ncbi:MAG: hypothetical protein HYR84_15070 [Planctomycetes bacterium]|nr:hypothetical protein [Planctomycetota bacterium]